MTHYEWDKNKIVETYTRIGACYFDLEEYGKAIKYYTKYLENIGLDTLSGRDLGVPIVAFYARGGSKYKMKDFYGAISDYNSTLFWINRFNTTKKDNTVFILPDQYEMIDDLEAKSYYNKAGCELAVHNYVSACKDLRRAGELGIEKAYDLIKESCN